MHDLLYMLAARYYTTIHEPHDGSTSNQRHCFLLLEFIVKERLGSIIHVGQALQRQMNHLEQLVSASTINKANANDDE